MRGSPTLWPERTQAQEPQRHEGGNAAWGVLSILGPEAPWESALIPGQHARSGDAVTAWSPCVTPGVGSDSHGPVTARHT